MSKIVLLTDTHFGARGDSEHLANFFDKFYGDFFFPYLKEHNISHITHLGDMFDKRKNINFVSLHRSKEYFFNRLVEYDIHIDVIVGNHDSPFKNSISINSPILLLQEYKDNVTVYSSPSEVNFGNTKIVYVPWICSENYQETIELISNTTSEILFGHLELDGFEMHRGSAHHGGMNKDVFSCFSLVCSGHFHHRSTKGNITYLGCPYEMSWADFNDPKGFHVFDTETLEMQFVENPFTLFNKIEYNDSKWTSKSWINGYDFRDITNTYVKVLVNEKTNPAWFDYFIEKIEKYNPIDVQIIDNELGSDLSGDDDISNVDDTLTILNKSVDDFDTKVDKNKLNGLFSSLYNEALDYGI